MAKVFDKFVDGLNKGVATISANSKAMAEKSQVKVAIKNLEAEHKELSKLLGMKIYEMYTETGAIVADECVINFVSEISKRLTGIAEKQKVLKQIEEEVSLITGAKSVSAQTGALCSCGQPAPAGSKFCAKCGSVL